jgi:transposase
MPAPVPIPVRKTMFKLFKRGLSTDAVAQRFGLPLRTVRRLAARFRERGEEGVRPSYVAKPVNPKAFAETVKESFVQLRREHPTWGSGYLRLRWSEAHPRERLPSDRSIREWLAEAGCTRPSRVRPPASKNRAAAVHDVWQMDAADQMTLGGGQGASWLRLVDEKSGAVLKTVVFPPTVLGARRRRRRQGGA